MANEIDVTIGLDDAEIRKGITALLKSIGKFEKETTQAVKKVDNTFSVFAGNLLANVAGKALGTLNGAITQSFTAFLDFEKSIKEINTILPKNTKLTQDLTDSLVNLSVEFATSAQEQARAFYQIISAGITDTSAAMEVLAAANVLSQGGLADLETTITGVTKVINVYGREAGTATDITDVFFTTVRRGTTRIEELANAMPQVLSLSKSLGVSFADASAAVATLSNRTATTSIATTQLAAIFASLLKNQAAARGILKENAGLFTLQALKAKGLAVFLQDLVKATGDTETLQKVLGGRKESLLGVLNLASDGFVSLTENIKEFSSGSVSGAAKRAAEEMQTALDFQLDKVTSGFNKLSTILLEKLSPSLTFAAKVLGQFLATPNQTGVTTELQLQALSSSIKKVQEDLVAARAVSQLTLDLGGTDEVNRLTDRLKELMEVRANLIIQIRDGSDKEKTSQEAATATAIEAKQREIDAEIEKNEKLREIRDLEAEEGLIFIQNILGEEAALKVAFNNARLEESNRFAEAQKVIDAGVAEAQKKLDKDAVSLAKKRADFIKKTEADTLRVRNQNVRSTIGLAASVGDAVNAIAGDNAVASLVIAKSAAVADVLIKASQAKMAATAASISAGVLGGPGAVASSLAAYNAAIATSTGIALGTIAAQTVASVARFQEGGIVGGNTFSGDNQLIRANSREMILTQAQQSQLFEIANGNQPSGSDERVVTLLGDLILAVQDQQTLEIDGAAVAKVVRDARTDGFEI